MNILLIDDHFCAREGVACLLKQMFPGLQVFEAESFDEGLAIARDTRLNLVLLDILTQGAGQGWADGGWRNCAGNFQACA